MVDEVHHVVFVDGIYLSRRLVVLIACTKTHVLGWYVARGETVSAWRALFDRIACPDVVVCDGGNGIATAVKRSWPTAKIQRCTFHAFNAVKRRTTTRPRTQAGVELYAIAKSLLYVDTREEAAHWLVELSNWNHRWKTFLAEKTTLPTGKRVDTHRRLIQARNSLNTLASGGTLFTYLEPSLYVADDPIPPTSNLIEGKINSQLRSLLRQHRGMPLTHQIKAVLWWCERHTQNPSTPAVLLTNTITDEQITRLFAQAENYRKAQQELNQWGTAIEWNDLHHPIPWRDTY